MYTAVIVFSDNEGTRFENVDTISWHSGNGYTSMKISDFINRPMIDKGTLCFF